MPIRSMQYRPPALASKFAALGHALLDALAPASCVACGTLVNDSRAPWCPDCSAELLAVSAQDYCPSCGRDAGPYQVVAGKCGRCGAMPLVHDGLVRVAPYAPILQRLILRYKFGGQQRLDRTLGRLLADRIRGAAWSESIDAVVPVPSHWTVRRHRGFFSTGQFAREAARALDTAYVELLVRPKRGRSQIGLSQTERRANVRGAFALRRGARVEGRTLCLIDDVMVTGATVHENVRVLKRAGAAAVCVAILAKSESVSS
jgi:ComF family protein